MSITKTARNTTDLTRLKQLSGLCLILLLAFGLRVYQLDQQSIWWDEGHSIFVAQHPIAHIPTLPAMDVHPPAYFALLHLWLGLAGTSEFALRYLSLIPSMLIVAMLWRFATLVISIALSSTSSDNAYFPAMAALLGAVSPLYIAYAQEVRGYSWLTFLALASTFLLYRRVVSQRKPSWRGDLAYVLLTASCLYTHYFSIFLLLFHNLMWLFWVVSGFQRQEADSHKSYRHRLGIWLTRQISILLIFAPQLLIATRQISDYANPNLLPPTLIQFLSQTWQTYTVGATVEPERVAGLLIGLAILLGIAWVSLLSRQPRTGLFLGGWLLVPLTAYFAVLQLRPSFEPRYLILISPSIFLIFALGWVRWGGMNYLLHAIIVAILSFGLHSYITNSTFFKEDATGVANWLAQETTANDLVLVDVPHPFHYYASRVSAPINYLFVDVHTAAQTLNQRAIGRDRLFWVTWAGSDTDPRGIIDFLARKQGQWDGVQEFRGYRVTQFALSEQTFSLPNELPAVDALFGDLFRLDGAQVGLTAQGGNVWATLHFSQQRQTKINYRVSVRVRRTDGLVIGQTDRDLLNDRHFRTSAWPLDDPALNQAFNVYLIPLNADAPAGDYQVTVVLYNAEPPYPSEGVFGANQSDHAFAIAGQVSLP